MPYSEVRSQVLALMRSEDPSAAFEAERVLRAWLDQSEGNDLDRADAYTRLGEAICRSGRPLLAFPELEKAKPFALDGFSQIYLWTVEALCASRAGDRFRARKLLESLPDLRRAWPAVVQELAPWTFKWESALLVVLVDAAGAVAAAEHAVEAAEALGKGRPEAYSAATNAYTLAKDFQKAILYGNLAVSVSAGRCRYEALLELLLAVTKAKETTWLDGIARQLRDTAPNPYRDSQAILAKVAVELIKIDPALATQFLSHFYQDEAS